MSTDAAPAVECRGLEYRFGDKVALAGIDLLVQRGEVFGLLGPNGAGKTTTLRILTTLARPTSGHLRILGHDVVAAPLEVRRRISVVIQETAVELLKKLK